MSDSDCYVATFKDDQEPEPNRLREMASYLDEILLEHRPSPEGWSHAELFAPYYLRCYARDLEAWNRRAGEKG